jgi:hypothetical protein
MRAHAGEYHGRTLKQLEIDIVTEMTILKGDEIARASLPNAGVRAGADSGDPQVGVVTLAPEALGNIGIWECQPGGWSVLDRIDTEVAYIISGSADLTDARTRKRINVTCGDVVILPPGWSGRWDVRETIRKVYVIY